MKKFQTTLVILLQNPVVKKEKDVGAVRPRHQSRRAASKEALKQMQILLEDEDDAVEIPDDDVSFFYSLENSININ